jgi:hypothetical protein
VQRQIRTRKFANTLLEAKRSGQLQAIAEEWERAHTEMASKACDLEALNERVKRGLLSAKGAGDLECVAEEMVVQVERQAAEMKALKERVFRALSAQLRSSASAGAQGDTSEPAAAVHKEDTQKEMQMKALQLKFLMKRAWRGLLESRRSGELEHIADEMAEQLQTKAEPIKNKIRKAMLRAHRAGELFELRDELDELADAVPLSDSPGRPGNFDELAEASVAAAAAAKVKTGASGRRWCEYTSSEDSDSSFDPREAARRRQAAAATIRRGPPPSGSRSSFAPADRRTAPAESAEFAGAEEAREGDVSGCSDVESSRGSPSPGPASQAGSPCK